MKKFFLIFCIKTIDYDETTTSINFLSDFDLPNLYFKGSMSKKCSQKSFFCCFQRLLNIQNLKILKKNFLLSFVDLILCKLTD